MIEIPDLSLGGFDHVSFRLTFESQRLVEIWGEVFFADSRWTTDGVELVAQRAEGELSTVVAQLVGGPDPEEGLESGVELELTLHRRRGFSLKPDEKASFDEIVGAVSEFVDVPAAIAVDARYSLARAQLPQSGIVNSMLGVRTRVGGEDLLVSGANLSIQGFTNDTISWYVQRGEKADRIAGSVSRRYLERLHSQSLVDALHVAQSRLRRLILEQHGEPAHGIAAVS